MARLINYTTSTADHDIGDGFRHIDHHTAIVDHLTGAEVLRVEALVRELQAERDAPRPRIIEPSHATTPVAQPSQSHRWPAWPWPLVEDPRD